MKIRSLCLILLIIGVTAGIHSIYAQTSIYDLVVEYQEAPIGIDVEQPRFSWKMATDDENLKGLKQTHYRIRVLDENDMVFWDSKKTRSGISLNIEYEGKKLEPRTRYTWNVTVWDNTGKRLTGSSHFEMGLLDDDPTSKAWNGAQWIGGGMKTSISIPMPYPCSGSPTIFSLVREMDLKGQDSSSGPMTNV